MTLYDFDTRTGPTGNRIVLGTLAYQFPIGDRMEVVIATQGLGSPDVAPQLNPEHNNANDTIYVGTLLTTFTF
jgi:hypothetical protein